jgi:hypothetical protein
MPARQVLNAGAGRHRLSHHTGAERRVVRATPIANDLDARRCFCIRGSQCGSHNGCHFRRLNFDLRHTTQVNDRREPEQGAVGGRLLLFCQRTTYGSISIRSVRTPRGSPDQSPGQPPDPVLHRLGARQRISFRCLQQGSNQGNRLADPLRSLSRVQLNPRGRRFPSVGNVPESARRSLARGRFAMIKLRTRFLEED